MDSRAAVIAGHSHTLALGVPLCSSDGLTRVVALPGEPRGDGLTGPWPRDDEYWTQVVALSRERTMAICWNGNQHLAGLLVSRPPFDFALRSRPDLPVDTASLLVPELAVRELLGRSLVALSRLLASILEAGGLPPIVLGTPPPKGNLEWVRRTLGTETHFTQLAEEAGMSLETIELSSPLVWLKSWLVVQRMMEEVAAAFSLRFCPSPADAQTPEGFLREAFWSSDVTHANEAYGMLMRRDIVRTQHASL